MDAWLAGAVLLSVLGACAVTYLLLGCVILCGLCWERRAAPVAPV